MYGERYRLYFLCHCRWEEDIDFRRALCSKLVQESLVCQSDGEAQVFSFSLRMEKVEVRSVATSDLVAQGIEEEGL